MEAADYSQAIEHGQQAIKIQQSLVEVDPNNSQFHYDLADILSNLGETYGRKGDLGMSDKYFNEAIDIFNKLKLKNADYTQMRSHNGNTYMTYAGILLSHGRVANALSNYRLARELLESSSDEDSLKNSPRPTMAWPTLSPQSVRVPEGTTPSAICIKDRLALSTRSNQRIN